MQWRVQETEKEMIMHAHDRQRFAVSSKLDYKVLTQSTNAEHQTLPWWILMLQSTVFVIGHPAIHFMPQFAPQTSVQLLKMSLNEPLF